jgi:hypothetical protein
LAIGALTVAGQYVIDDVDRLVPKAVPAIALAFSAADEHLDLLRRLDLPFSFLRRFGKSSFSADRTKPIGPGAWASSRNEGFSVSSR